MIGGMTSIRRSAVLAVALLALAGCGSDTSTTGATPTPTPTPSESLTESASAEPSPSKTKPSAAASVRVRISGDAVTPVAQEVELGVGELLELVVDSDRTGELHVHSSPEQFPAIKAGKSIVEITFDKPGQVDIEEHDSGVLIVRALVR